MSVLLVVLPLAVLLSGLAAVAFIWATRLGQFDDLETPAVRLLSDELCERASAIHVERGPKRDYRSATGEHNALGESPKLLDNPTTREAHDQRKDPSRR